MKTLSKEVFKNLGGINLLWLIPSTNILTIVKNYSTNLYDITLDDFDDYWAIEFTQDSVDHIEQEDTSLGSAFYKNSLSAFVAGSSAENRDKLEQLKNRSFIAVYQNSDGNFKMVGTNDEPLILTIDSQTPREFSGLKGNTLKLSGDCMNRSVFINNPFLGSN